MDTEERIEKIKQLQEYQFKSSKRASVVINNFFSIITIIVVCISIIFYTVYVVPAQKAKTKRLQKIKERQLYLKQRAKQIALSHKLNDKKKK
jgi:hypothetical protein